jgi:hypothetical protein
MAQIIDRIRRSALPLALVLLIGALLACKKSGGGEDTSSDDSSESDSAKDDSAKDDSAKDDSAKDDSAKDDSAKDDSAKGGDAKDAIAKDDSTKDGAAGQFKVGDPVDVEWKGDWWKAEVKKVRSGPVYYVHYVDWGNEWDEWVAPRRIRARTAGSRTK